MPAGLQGNTHLQVSHPLRDFVRPTRPECLGDDMAENRDLRSHPIHALLRAVLEIECQMGRAMRGDT